MKMRCNTGRRTICGQRKVQIGRSNPLSQPPSRSSVHPICPNRSKTKPQSSHPSSLNPSLQHHQAAVVAIDSTPDRSNHQAAVVAIESAMDRSKHQAAVASPCIDKIRGKESSVAVDQKAVSCTGAVAGAQIGIPIRESRYARYFHKLRNKFHCPIVNLDRLWSLDPEDVKAKSTKDKVPLIDVTQHGFFKVLGKGHLPENRPFVVKAKLISKTAEKKIKEAGGAVVLTA
uniref:Large ribosomal subunit protein uL15/eL18 domain-containing protein n=1 Tax=Brassica oleracea var. oleracea TaxID=109376 RepID=A0A0D3DCU2_BRAOL